MRFHLLFPLAAIAALPACSPHPSASEALAQSVSNGLGSAQYARGLEHSIGLLDPEHDGKSDSLHLVGLAWGRLADVYARETATGPTRLVARDFVIGEMPSQDGEWIVETEPVTGTTSVTILHAPGSEAFTRALAELESGLVPISEKGLDLAELPPFPMVPRNAAIVARFDDLLDLATIAGSIEVRVGTPPVALHAARVFADRHHGGYVDGDGALEFHPTRVIVDLAVSEREARAGAAVIAPSPAGLPASASASVANVALRFATEGPLRLANLAGKALDARANGSVAPGTHGIDVVRALRSGGPDDLYQGLLADTDPPRILGRQSVTMTAIAPDPQGGPNDYLIDLEFAATNCAQAATPRDAIDFQIAIATITQPSSAPIGNTLTGVHARFVGTPPTAPAPAPYLSPYDPVVDSGKEACFVEIFGPLPPVTLPARGVGTTLTIIVNFTEFIDPATSDTFDGLQLTRVAVPDSPDDYVAATYSIGLFTPLVPLDHVQGQAESYFFTVRDTLRDLAGNPLAAPLAQFELLVDPAAPTTQTGNHVLRFDSTDEDGDGKPELRGQFLYDLVQGELRPRPVTRYSAVADRTQAIPGVMPIFAQGVQVPLTPFGAKLQSLYRYCDVGFGLLDETNHNVDVEGLAWAPVGGAVVADQYDAFEIALAHGRFLPDEVINPQSLLPLYPNSGIVANYAQNQLDPVNDPLKVVHPRQLGYTVNPADLFVSQTGTTMIPYPLNRGIPVSQHQYYTWRDTSVLAKAAPAGVGAPLAIEAAITGGQAGSSYPPGQVPTIGLPLLMEFKCFPDASALGLNAFDVSLAANSSSKPNFRAFSAGGINVAGQTITVDPDTATVASGGFNPNSNPPGLPGLPVDNVFYIGQMDLVVRVSRAHGRWIDTLSSNTTFATPVIDPAPSDQPSGTSVVLAWRGASAVVGAIGYDANELDAYGEPKGLGSGQVTYFQNDSTWKPSLSQLDGARLVQPRITFVSNTETGDVPTLSGLGIAFTR